jgi:plastocyanin
MKISFHKLIILAGFILLYRPATLSAKTVQIAIENVQFSPNVQTANAGDEIVWENKDLVPHTVTAENGSFDSKLIAPGSSWKMKAHQKGEFAYKCSFHPNMKANLKVQ